jgi:hypothetical protein
MWDKVGENERSLRFAALLGLNGTPSRAGLLADVKRTILSSAHPEVIALVKKLDGSSATFNPTTLVSSVKPLLDAIAANDALGKVVFVSRPVVSACFILHVICVLTRVHVCVYTPAPSVCLFVRALNCAIVGSCVDVEQFVPLLSKAVAGILLEQLARVFRSLRVSVLLDLTAPLAISRDDLERLLVTSARLQRPVLQVDQGAGFITFGGSRVSVCSCWARSS